MNRIKKRRYDYEGEKNGKRPVIPWNLKRDELEIPDAIHHRA